MKVGVVGVGSFGEKRARAVQGTSGTLVAVADSDPARAAKVAASLGVAAETPEALIARGDVDVVVVSVPNRFHHTVALAAIEAGKHVLVEKPLARTSQEARALVEAARARGVKIKTGSNHRHFPSVRKARELVDAGAIGEPLHFNGRIGNDGERIRGRWFWDPDLAGGGTLLDNGCHLLDLARWFLGDFTHAVGMVGNTYWRDCPVEDTASGVLRTASGKMAVVSSSWRLLSGYFHFELNGSEGYLTVDGRFDTHGGDRLYWQRRGAGGEIQAIDFGHVPPTSYRDELEGFLDDLRHGREPRPSGEDGLAVVKMVEAIYRGSQQGRVDI